MHVTHDLTLCRLTPRLHHATCRPETCIPDEQHTYMSTDTCRRIRIKLIVLDTCRWILGDIISLLFIYVTVDLYPFVFSNRRATKLATILSPMQDTCRRRQGIQVDRTCIRAACIRCKRGTRINYYDVT